MSAATMFLDRYVSAERRRIHRRRQVSHRDQPDRYVTGVTPRLEAWTHWPLSNTEIVLLRHSRDSVVVG